MDVRWPPKAVSLLYLNPPYDWESGESNNQRLELVFLEYSYRWLRAGGVLVFVIPQLRLAKCARLLSEHFTDLRVFGLTEPACLEYKQIVVLETRRKRHSKVSDAALLDGVRYLEALATKSELEPLGDNPEVRYEVPASEPVVLTHVGIPLDEVEDLLLESAAYRQAGRVLLPKLNEVKGRPLTPLHGGHVGLLYGVFGEREDRHIAHWRSVRFTDHWEEEEEDGTKILHDREPFSHELTLVFANGKTQILTREKKEAERKIAHLRFGWLTYVKSTEKTTTSIKLRLDRFIGEILPDPPRQAKRPSHFRDWRGHAGCGRQCSHLLGRQVHVGGAGCTADSSVSRRKCAVLQRLGTACRAQEAPASPHRFVRRVCCEQRIGEFGPNAAGKLGKRIHPGLHRPHSRNPVCGGQAGSSQTPSSNSP